MRFAKALGRSLNEFKYCLEVNMFCQQSTSRLVSLEPPSLNNAARIAKDSSTSLDATGQTGLTRHCKRVSGKDSTGLGCFCFSEFNVLLFNRRIPFNVYQKPLSENFERSCSFIFTQYFINSHFRSNYSSCSCCKVIFRF